MFAFAPLFFLRGKGPKRSVNWNANPVGLHDVDDRAFQLKFMQDKDGFYNDQIWSPQDLSIHKTKSQYDPPPHYHLYADEHFYISAGSGVWHLWDRDVQLKKGDHFVLPPREWHWFESDPSTEEPLIIHVKYDEGKAAMEERFFRNTLSYVSDCLRDKVSPSIFQLMVFFIGMEMAPGLRIVPWEKVNLALNVLFMYAIGGIGWLMGYRYSYDEYYRPRAKSS